MKLGQYSIGEEVPTYKQVTSSVTTDIALVEAFDTHVSWTTATLCWQWQSVHDHITLNLYHWLPVHKYSCGSPELLTLEATRALVEAFDTHVSWTTATLCWQWQSVHDHTTLNLYHWLPVHKYSCGSPELLSGPLCSGGFDRKLSTAALCLALLSDGLLSVSRGLRRRTNYLQLSDQ